MSHEGAPAVRAFEDLIAWQKARELVREVMRFTAEPPLAARRAYRDQLERAAISAMSNIAEGYERGGRAEFYQFLSIAEASCAEVRSLLYVALDAELIDQPTFDRLHGHARETARVIGGLRASVRRLRDEGR
jgi:four helix bundle protein